VGVGSASPAHYGGVASGRFAPQVMTDLCGRSPNIIGRVPSTKPWAVESHSTRSDVEKGSHDDDLLWGPHRVHEHYVLVSVELKMMPDAIASPRASSLDVKSLDGLDEFGKFVLTDLCMLTDFDEEFPPLIF
jgi:hypothetical protein